MHSSEVRLAAPCLPSAILITPSSTSEPVSLPLDIFGLIAKHLVAQDLHGSCAALNLTCKAVRDETTPILWKRVVYQWNNSASSKKKAAVKWRGVFESSSARYIQYVLVHSHRRPLANGSFRQRFLVAIPSYPPRAEVEEYVWEPPFLSLILADDNLMKACIIAADAGILSVLLYENYEPCTPDLLSVMECGAVM